MLKGMAYVLFFAGFGCCWITHPVPLQHFHSSLSARKKSNQNERAYEGETIPDRCLRYFWESQTFETTNQILDKVIYEHQIFSPLLIPDAPDEDSSELFSPLFEVRTMHYIHNELGKDDSLQSSRKKSFRLDIAYRGSVFCGWQTQSNNKLLPSVQQSLEELLQPLISHTASSRVDVRASGRTDAGVSALGQVCRFQTYQDASTAQVLNHVNASPLVEQGSLRCLNVTAVPDSFHPTFGCTKRAYVYIVDLNDLRKEHVTQLDTMLRCLEGQELDYLALSYGKIKTETTFCRLEVARAFCARSSEKRVICIELIGDRFLRRMVRIVVATAMREVFTTLGEEGHTRLLDIVNSRDRTRSAKAAPPEGLIFVGAVVKTKKS